MPRALMQQPQFAIKQQQPAAATAAAAAGDRSREAAAVWVPRQQRARGVEVGRGAAAAMLLAR